MKIDLTAYQLRFVKSVSELKKKKIVIKENGLDDRIVEIMKHNIQTTLRSKASYQLVLRDGQGLEFFYYIQIMKLLRYLCLISKII